MSEINTSRELSVAERIDAKTLHLPDGRTMLWWQNVEVPRENGNPLTNVRLAERVGLCTAMASRGVFYIPEMTPTTIHGYEFRNSIGVYVDERITKWKAHNAFMVLHNKYRDLAYSKNVKNDFDFIPVTLDEVKNLVDDTLRETGLDEVVDNIRLQDTAKLTGRTTVTPELPAYDTGM